MDSCHIFNFLFGTKKASTELGKFCTSISEQARARRRSSRDRERHAPAPEAGTCRVSHSQPSSPLKQIQMKIANLASSTATNLNTNRKQTNTQPNGSSTSNRPARGTSCDARCGTYRATLVRLESNSDLESEGELENLLQQQPEESSSTMTSQKAAADDDDKTSIKRGKLELTHCIETTEKLSRAPRQVVLYGNCEPSDCNLDHTNEPDEQLITSAQVYSISPSSEDPPRASKLFLTGSIVRRPSEEEETQPRLEIRRIPPANDKKQAYVKSLVKSIESNGSFDLDCEQVDSQKQTQPTVENHRQKPLGFTKPVTFVKPMPPKTPPKSNKVKLINLQLNLNKPYKIQQLFHDETFLARFFNKLEPLDRCVAAQVCRKWRDVLYANQNYWKDLINVIDCTQLRREQLVDCILSTLQNSAKLQNSAIKRNQLQTTAGQRCNNNTNQESNNSTVEQNNGAGKQRSDSTDATEPNIINMLDQDDIWRIQELCNRFTSQRQQQQARNQSSERQVAAALTANNHPNEPTANLSSNSKSSSIPSQISSTFSSVSLSSLLLSPLSESNKIDTMKEKLYNSLDDRGFDALCLFGATDDDIDDLVAKIRPNSQRRIIIGRLNNCCISDKGLDLFIKTFSQIRELELSGCNEISNSIELRPLMQLKRLIITDSINIADGFAQKLCLLLPQLDELTLQAYHLTDAFLEYLATNSDTSRLRRLELPNCKEITNQSLVIIAKHFSQLEALSISGSTKISDEGIELLAELARQLQVLDLSWCSRITDASLECIACDLADNLRELILDRNVNITDAGLGYLSAMSRLSLLHIRWCPRISDLGLESVLSIRSLKYLSLAGLHQVTARSLLCLVDANLHEVELTNCPAVNKELLVFLEQKMPNCNIIF